MSYYIRKQHVPKPPLLDELARESGKLYSKTVTFFWRTVRKKGIWLKPSSLMRIFNSNKMHAHSADASVQAFFHSLKSWRAKRKTDPNARPPKRRRYYFNVVWKKSAIRLKNGSLLLSNGRKQTPLTLNNWQYNVPLEIKSASS